MAHWFAVDRDGAGDNRRAQGTALTGVNTLTVLTNNGRGVFSQNLNLNQGNIPNIWPANINGDGKPTGLLRCAHGPLKWSYPLA